MKEEAIEKYALSKDAKPKALFGKIGIVGCGEVGRSIARMVSARGIDVVFVEISEEQKNKSLKSLSLDLDEIIERWGMTKGEKRAILSRIKGDIDYNILKGSDIVIEAINSTSLDETITERQEIFKKIENIVSEDTIIASNSATLFATKLANNLKKPDRCLTFHFISPAPDARIIEVVKGKNTSDKALEKVENFAQLLGKKTIVVKESPGIISARLVVPLINEACDIYLKGISSMKDIDCTMSAGFGIPFGPFAMADKIGLDKLLKWCNSLHKEYKDSKYEASNLIEEYVKEGKLGRKMGQGFYKYNENGNRIK